MVPKDKQVVSTSVSTTAEQQKPFKMTDEDRHRRAKFLHAQELTDREPMNVPELERMIYNPIRRLYRYKNTNKDLHKLTKAQLLSNFSLTPF